MITRTRGALLGGALAAIAAVAPVDAQVRGHAVVDGGAVRVNVAFGDLGAGHFGPTRVALRRSSFAGRRGAGMARFELERYLAHLDREYEILRSMSPREAHFRRGWTRQELQAHLRWLRQERREVRAELSRFERGRHARIRHGR